MKNIERAKTFLYICDYFGYCKGKKYYITRVNSSDSNYVAKQAYVPNDAIHAFTLKEMSAKLSAHTPKVS